MKYDKYEEAAEYQQGRMSLLKKLRRARRRLRRKNVDEAYRAIAEVETEMALDGSGGTSDVAAREDILKLIGETGQEKKIVSDSKRHAKGTGIWMLARPPWQISAALGAVAALVLRRNKKKP